MDESINRLRALVAVAEHNNVVQAARELNLSQPAVTKAIRTLESNLGVQLFDRTPRGMLPTIFGETLIRRAKLVFAELRSADMELAALKGLETGGVAVGTTPIARSVLLPEAIRRLVAESPGLSVVVLEGTYDVLASQIRSGDLELLIGTVIGSGALDGFHEETLIHDQLVVVSRRGHPLAKKKSISLTDLAEADWILPFRDSPQRQQFGYVFENQGLKLKSNIIASNSLSTIRELLISSDRLTILSPHRIRHEVSAGIFRILPADLRETRRPIGVTWRESASLSPAAEMLLTHLRAVAGEVNSQEAASKKTAA